MFVVPDLDVVPSVFKFSVVPVVPAVAAVTGLLVKSFMSTVHAIRVVLAMIAMPVEPCLVHPLCPVCLRSAICVSVASVVEH